MASRLLSCFLHITKVVFLGTDHLTCRGRLWFFVSFRNFFSDNTRVRIFIFFVAQSAKFFSQNSTLDYMTKSLNQIIFFSSTKIRIFFSETLGIRIFFLEKKHNPPPSPPPFKLNGRSYSLCNLISGAIYKAMNAIRIIL